MSFSAEMRDFVKAYESGQKVNASKSDAAYRDAQTDALKRRPPRRTLPKRLRGSRGYGRPSFK